MAFSALSVINALSPKESASRRVAADIPYGPHPRQRLDLYAPASPRGPLPVVVFVYGGSWMDGEKGNYAFVGRAVAALGYLTAIADYRLVPEVEYPRFLEDCADAVEAVAALAPDHGGRADTIALMGHSAGAYNAMMIALDPGYLKARGLLGRIKAIAGLSGPYDFYPLDGPISLRTFGAVEDLRATQPVNHVGTGLPPVFLGTGERDRLVYPRNTAALAGRLRQKGVSVTVVEYAGIGHAAPVLALARPFRFIAPVLEDVRRFLGAELDRSHASRSQGFLPPGSPAR